MPPLSEARKRANKKWDAANLTVLGCKVRKDYAEKVKAAAAANGTTVGAIIRKALDSFMEEYDSKTE